MIWPYFALVLLVSFALIFFGYRTLSLQLKFLRKDAENYKKKFLDKTSELASVRVKHGQAWEVFVPIMDKFQEHCGDKNDAIFLGKPIDLIYFNKDEVLFVEVKTGNAKLSQKQRAIKKLIKDGKVRWMEVNDALESVLPDTDQTNSVDTKTVRLSKEQEKLLDETYKF